MKKNTLYILASLLLASSIAFAGAGSIFPPQSGGSGGDVSSGGTVTSNGLALNDDLNLGFGTGSPVKCVYETADANANELVCTTPEGGGTDVANFVFGDVSAFNVDLGLFNGITDPTISILSDDGTKAIKISHDGTNGVIDVTSGSVSIPDGVIGNVTGNLTGAVTGNASTATALAANPSDCSANQFATTIAASGNLTCAALADADVPNAITISGGTVDNSIIGGSTAAAGTFTTLTGTAQATFTRDPASTTTANASVRINPATSASNEIFLGIQDNGTDVLTVDKEGDIIATGNITMGSGKTIDGRDVSVDGAKLDGLPSSAYATVGVDGSSQTQRGRINHISGTGIAQTVADNNGTNSTDQTTSLSYSSTQAGNPALTAGQAVFDSGDAQGGILFEGATANTSESLLTVTEPTGDRVWTLPDVTGTIVTSGDTGSVTSTMILNGTVATGDLASALSSPAASTTLVGTGRTLTAGAGISTLGDLSADRTVSIGFWDIARIDTAQTTSGTAVNIGTAVTLASNSSLYIQYRCVALKSDFSATAFYGREVAYRSSSGTVTIVTGGSKSVPTTDGEDDATWGGPGFTISGSTVQPTVQGVVSQTINWRCNLLAMQGS